MHACIPSSFFRLFLEWCGVVLIGVDWSGVVLIGAGGGRGGGHLPLGSSRLDIAI